jgi:hypothetical protein
MFTELEFISVDRIVQKEDPEEALVRDPRLSHRPLLLWIYRKLSINEQISVVVLSIDVEDVDSHTVTLVLDYCSHMYLTVIVRDHETLKLTEVTLGDDTLPNEVLSYFKEMHFVILLTLYIKRR